MATRARRSPEAKPEATPPRLQSWRVPRWLFLLFRAAIALFAFCAFYPVRYHPTATGLDPSWAVALNQFHARGLVFGRDVGLTYGPLAYLTLPMPFGNNLEHGILFQLIFWFLFGALLAWFVVNARISTLGLAVFAFCAPAAARMIHEFGYAGPDLFVEFLALLLMASCLVGPEILYYAAVAVAALLMLIKLSTGIGAVSAMLLFAASVMLYDRRKGLRLLTVAAVGTPLSFALLFTVLAGPLGAIGPYVRSALEISSGHSSALSLAGPDRELYFALIIGAGFLALAASLWWRSDRAFPIASAMIAPLFLEFKHSFIRQDSGHIGFVFTFAAFALGAAVLFVETRSARSWPAIASVVLISVPWLLHEQGRYWNGLISPAEVARRIETLLHFDALKRALSDQSSAALATDKLAPELLARIGKQSITIYPWENAIAAANPIDYRPFPVFQVYDAYTAYLDGWNAAFLRDASSRPDLVLFDWAAIDERHPLLDCPQTLLSLYLNYEFDSQFGDTVLLRKRTASLVDDRRLVATTSIRIGQPLHVQTGKTAFVQIKLRHSVIGWLEDFLFRVAPVYITLADPQDRTLVARIPPGVVPGGIPLTFVPQDLQDMRRLFEHGVVNARWNTIALTGPGSEVFTTQAEVQVFELSGIDVRPRDHSPAGITALHDSGWISDGRIELINGEGVSAVSEKEVVGVPSKQGIVTVQGFAVPSSNRDSLYLDVDGKLHAASWGSWRGDVAMIHGVQAGKAGFTVSLPAWMFGTSTHQMRVVEVSEDETKVWRAEKAVSFRMVR